jgi:hypothetical protein
MRYLALALTLILTLVQFTPAASAPDQIYDGRPVFSQGTDLGYFIWRDGDTWHVRWTTKGQKRRFSGAVETTGGKLKSLKRIDVESERKVLYPGRPGHVWVGPRGRVHSRRGRAPVVAERKEDKIEKDGDYRIVFSSLTDDDIDGFDFKVDNETGLLRFMLQIDGRPEAQRVELGKGNVRAERLPLVLALH